MEKSYRYTDEKSDKFWVIESSGNALAVHYGKTGSIGRFQLKEYEDESEREKQEQKLIAAKVKKGYVPWEGFNFNHCLYFDDEEIGLHPLTSHPHFRKHFTADFYYDCSDDEAPFGSDDGNDTLHLLCEYIRKMRDADLMYFPRQLQEQDWGLEWFEPTAPTEAEVKALLGREDIGKLPASRHLLACDHVIVASAFGQIKVMGRVFDRLREMALCSLRRMALVFRLEGYGESHAIPQMITDLERFQNPEHTPSEVARTIVNYLDCPCRVFAPSLDDDDIIYAYNRALEEGAGNGHTPLLIVVSDTLLESITIAVNEDSDMDFDSDKVRAWREKTLAETDSLNAAAFLKGKEQLPRELIGKVNLKKGELRNNLCALWGSEGNTYEVILAKLPTANPWEAAIYVPMGGFNDCPGPAEQAAVMRYWYEKHGAFPALVTYDEWEFCAPPVVSLGNAPALSKEEQDKLLQLAAEQYIFCTDRVDQYSGGVYTLGDLASSLAISSRWYFWWD